MDIDGWGRAPAAVAVLRATRSGGSLAALLAELDAAAVCALVWCAELGPSKQAELLDMIQRAGFRSEPCTDGAPLAAGLVYLAPTDRRVWFEGSGLRIGAPSAHERPSLERLLQSLARAWGRRSIVLAPEPLGIENERGLLAVRRAGGDVRVVTGPCLDGGAGSRSASERSPATERSPGSQRGLANERAVASEKSPASERRSGGDGGPGSAKNGAGEGSRGSEASTAVDAGAGSESGFEFEPTLVSEGAAAPEA
ncbi:MAG TPA: chemotaxis protein CheB, partial [Polyangiaceae bacterium]|nr:chemotaxis protein CheB [Polyangiaceae bacterium]